MSENHSAIQFLSALSKDIVSIRLLNGKGFKEVEYVSRQTRETKFLKGYNLSKDNGNNFDWNIENNDQSKRLILELARQNALRLTVKRGFPYRTGGWVPYAVINNGGHAASDITDCVALFIEHDAPITKEESLLKIESFELQPSIIVESRNSYHYYWLLDIAVSPEKWREYQWRMIARFDSDDGIEDYPRLMRLPGFDHLQAGEDPYPVLLKKCDSSLKYSLEAFDLLLPAIPDYRLQREQTLVNWEQLDGDNELFDIRKYIDLLEGYKHRNQWSTAKCPLHDGKSFDSLHIFNDTGAYVCHAGCSSLDIVKLLNPNWKPTKKANSATSSSKQAKNKKTATEAEEEADRYPLFIRELDRIAEIDDPGKRYYDLKVLGSTGHPSLKFAVSELLTMHDKAGQNKPLEFQTASEFLKDVPDAPEWILEGLLSIGQAVILSGDAKTGKSILAYEMALAVATQVSLGDFRCREVGQVVIFQTDENKKEAQERMLAKGFAGLDNVHINTSFKIEQLKQLEKKLLEIKPKLVIIDSLTTVNINTEVNENAAEYCRSLYELKDIADRCNCAIIIIHHNNKQHTIDLNRVSGTKKLPAAVSQIWMVSNIPKLLDPIGLRRVFTRLNSRNNSEVSYLIELNWEDYSWNWLGECDPLTAEVTVTTAQSVAVKDKILNCIMQHFPKRLEAMEIAQLIEIDAVAIRKGITRLLTEDMVFRAKSTVRQKAYVYYMKLPGQGDLFMEISQEPLQIAEKLAGEPKTITIEAISNEQQKKEPIVFLKGSSKHVKKIGAMWLLVGFVQNRCQLRDRNAIHRDIFVNKEELMETPILEDS